MGPFKPAEFVTDYLTDFEETLAKVPYFFCKFPNVQREWDEFGTQYPDTDSVEEYVQRATTNYRIPLASTMFEYLQVVDSLVSSNLGSRTTVPASDEDSDEESIPTEVATHSITWSNRGVPQRTLPSRLPVANRHNIDLEDAMRQVRANYTYTQQGLSQLHLPELKSICRDHSLRYSGKNKHELITLILEKLGPIMQHDDTGSTSSHDEGIATTQHRNQPAPHNRQTTAATQHRNGPVPNNRQTNGQTTAAAQHRNQPAPHNRQTTAATQHRNGPAPNNRQSTNSQTAAATQHRNGPVPNNRQSTNGQTTAATQHRHGPAPHNRPTTATTHHRNVTIDLQAMPFHLVTPATNN
jgi:hypothetical protein